MNLKRLIFLALFLQFIASQIANSQSNWLTRFGGKGNDEALCSSIAKNGNIYTAGYFSLGAEFGNSKLISSGSGDVFISCQDSLGNLIWSVQGGGARSDRAYGITTNDSGYIFVTGTYSGSVTFGLFSLVGTDSTQNVFVAKLDSLGNYIWVKSFGGIDNELAYSIAADSKGNSIVVGQFKGVCQFGGQSLTSKTDPISLLPSYDIFILKLDSVGDVVWVKQGTASYDDRANSIAISKSNDIYITGQFSDSITFDSVHNFAVFNAGFILKLNEFGNEQWFKPFFGSQINTKSIFNFQNGIALAGDYAGNFNYDGLNTPSLTGPKNYNYFILLVDSNGILQKAKGEGSDHPMNLNSANAIADSIYIAGNFRCNMTDFSNSLGTGVFNSVGFRDIFIAGYSSLLERIWERQLGGPGDDYVSSIALTKNFNSIIAGSFQTNFNAPNGGKFIQNAVTFDSSAFGPQQYSNFCGDQYYRSYKSIYSDGFKDILSASAIDLNRLTYDYFDRNNFNCIRDSLIPYINQNQDSLIACDSIHLYATLKTGRDGVIGPEYFYNWSNGNDQDTITITQTGWYSLQIKTVDECRVYIDSVFVTIYPSPPTPIINSINGRMQYAIPVYCCNLKLLYNDTIPTFLYCNNAPPGYLTIWNTPFGTVINDTIQVISNGCYSCVIRHPNSFCASSECVQVHNFISTTSCFPSLFVPKLIFNNAVFNATDTVEICENETFNMEVVDSASYLHGQHPDLVTTIYWQISGGFKFEFPSSAPFTFLQHQQIFFPTQAGRTNCSVTITIQNPLNGLPLYTLTRNFYLIVNPLPISPSFITGPQYFCPADTVILKVLPSRNCIFNGPGIIYTSNNNDEIRVITEGEYLAEFIEVDSITGCSIKVKRKFLLKTTPSPKISMVPSNGIICPGDSVLLTAENGTNYIWNGPLNSNIDSTQSIWVKAAGSYHYTVTDTGGCRLISEFSEIKEYSSPYITANPAPVLCLGGDVTISIQTNDPNGIIWNSPLSGNNEMQIITSPGVYSCSVESCGITTMLNVNITQSNVKAEINLGDSITICQGDTLSLNANNGMASYLWTPSGTNSQNFVVFSAGVYILQTEDLYGCIALDSIQVDTFPKPISPTVNNDFVCLGSSSLLVASANGPISWFANSIGGTPFYLGDSLNISSLNSSTNYFVSASDGRCNSDRIIITASVNPVSQTPIITADTVICFLDTLVLSVPQYPAAIYSWSGPNSFLSSNNSASILNANPLNSGYYYIQISDSFCTGPLDSIFINVNPAFQVQIISQGKNPLCPGDTLKLYSDSIYSHYKWLPNNSILSTLNVKYPGVYSLIATDKFGCTSVSNLINVSISTVPAPPIITGNNSVCKNDTLMLSIQPVSGASYSWFPPNSSTSISNDSALVVYPTNLIGGNYSVVGTSMDGCKFSNSIAVNAIAIPQINVSGSTNICDGGNLNLAISNQIFNYLKWTGPNNFQSISNAITIPQVNGSNQGYYVINLIKGVCNVFDSVNVIVQPKININLGNDTTLCFGDDLYLQVPQIFNTYIWNNSMGNTNTTRVDTSGLWTLTVTYGNGCIATDSININIINCKFSIPNIISPNADGKNDFLEVNYPEASSITLKIFNRWGDLINNLSSMSPRWDGRDLHGKIVVEGTYYYTVSISDFYKRAIDFKGSITVVN